MPEGWGAYQKLGLAVRARHGIYVPHLAVVPKAALSATGHVTPAAAAELVVEIASVGNAVHDGPRSPPGMPAQVSRSTCSWTSGHWVARLSPSTASPRAMRIGR